MIPDVPQKQFLKIILLSRQKEWLRKTCCDYHEDCVILINSGEYRGHAGARRLADQLAREMPEAEFEYTTKLVSGRFAFLEWTGSSKTASVQDGADSFVIENGKIVAQTIHYTLIAN